MNQTGLRNPGQFTKTALLCPKPKRSTPVSEYFHSMDRAYTPMVQLFPHADVLQERRICRTVRVDPRIPRRRLQRRSGINYRHAQSAFAQCNGKRGPRKTSANDY